MTSSRLSYDTQSTLDIGGLRVVAENLFKPRTLQTLALIGSFARGTPSAYSDIDLITIDEKGGEPRYERVLGRLLVLKPMTWSDIEEIFNDPDSLCDNVSGFRSMLPIVDPDGELQRLQQRAVNFEWTKVLSEMAVRWEQSAIVGWLEEVNKALDGLERREEWGRQLQALHGLTWGLLRLMKVHFRVLATSDNTVLSEVCGAVGEGSAWTTLCHRGFGLKGEDLTIRARLHVGLALFKETVSILARDGVLTSREHALLAHSLQDIDRVMAVPLAMKNLA